MMMMKTGSVFFCYVFVIVWSVTESRPLLSSNSAEDDLHKMSKAMMYLMKYGYMDGQTEGRSANLLSSDALRNSIMEFQRFAGLNETGVMDEATETMMSLPRCGVKDIVGHVGRAKRYALQGSRWRVRDLTYKISSYPSTPFMSKEDVDNEVREALSVWAEVTDLTFTKKESGKVHIDIKFAKREHGDGDPFDGQGRTLAHAFFPVFGGDAHFDDDEFWTTGTFRGTNLLQTAAHEFGHSLGLSHSDNTKALMAPFYRGFEKKIRLNRDDIKGIQELYGEKTERRRPGIDITIDNNVQVSDDDDDRKKEDDEELCNDASIDAIVTVKDGTTYAFKSGNYWKLTDDSIAKGYPRRISLDWDGLPADLDAAFTWINGKTYFFKGSRYWRFTNLELDDGYPKQISSGFEGIPDNVDAAFVWSGNEKIYFFKGSQYYKFDPEKKPPVSRSYPKPISNWEGIPDDIDDALRYSNGYTYFFKDGRYWRFDDRKFRVDSAEPDFPRPAGFWWFGCSSLDQGIVSTRKRNGRDDDNDGDGGGRWDFLNWMFGDRADVPVNTDKDFGYNDDDTFYYSNRGDSSDDKSSSSGRGSKSLWNRFKNVFKSVLKG